MKTIDIRTTQNVTISYELAEARDRILAFIIDTVVKSVSLLILWWLYIAIFDELHNNGIDYFMYILLVPIVTFYTLFFEVILNGQTPGKKLLKIKVIKLDGKQPVFYDYLIRWTFRIIDIMLSFGVVGTIMIVSTEHAQRLGDLTSNTTLVRVNSRVNISLKDILRIDTRKNYEPKYAEISQFQESDILLIKQAIERYQKYKNDAHRKAIVLLCEKLQQRMKINDVGPDKIAFLKTVIKDYIVLTR